MPFEYRQAQEVRDAFAKEGARFLFIIASKKAANRAKDRESLPRLQSFREYWMAQQRRSQKL